MKQLKSILAALAATLATVAGLDLTGFTHVLPPNIAAIAVVVPSAAAIIAHLCTALKANIDEVEKEIENQGKPSKLQCNPIALIAAAIAACLALNSCAVTTAPDGSVTKRFDTEAANPFFILARDLFVPRTDGGHVEISDEK